ncbi:ribonuclease H-like domain-containing protein [Tanacetum coccineum]|uniref:Ribonuclease H-like domain-containing protein n=1 Tax=Tanacetum coccineum TaxID=301880 RepID=A0ABQ4XMT8_9ASTR
MLAEGHDLLSSRVILSKDDYDRGCRKPSDLEDGFYRDTSKLGPEYLIGMDYEGEVIELNTAKDLRLPEEDNDCMKIKTCEEIFILYNLRIEFNKSEFNLATYKRGLASVEEQLVFYKKNEVMFCDQIAILKRDTSFKDSEINALKSEIKKLKKEKFEGYGPKASKSVCKDTSNEVKKTPDAPLGSLQLPSKGRDGHSQKEHQGYVDSGCSRHMTGNMSYLSDFKEFDEGYVTFGGGARGGRITGKETLKTGKLDFKDVYFVKELQFNLFSVSQMCDKKNSVLLKVPRKKNMYSVDMKNIIPKESLTCLVANVTLDESMLWHRRLGHINFKTINKLVKDNLVRRLPIKHFENDQTCVACFKGKQHKASFIKRDFSVARTPQQNGVAERRNRTLIEAVRTMLADFKLPTTFWAKAVNTACYVQNRVIIVKPHNKTPYELFRGRTPALSFIRPFGCHITILNTLDHLGKFNGKSNNGFFVRYSLTSKAFRVYNIRTRKVEENFHIRFLENKPIVTGDGPKWLFDIDSLTKSMNYVPVVVGTNSNDFVGSEESSGAGHTSKETEFSQDYIVMPLWKDEKNDDEGVSKASGFSDQEQPKSSTPNINTDGPSINTASANFKTGSLYINTVSPTVITTRSNRSQNVSNMFSLGRSDTHEATHANLFGDETEMNMSNLTTSYQVPTTPNTRIHKDHSLNHVIGDI